MQCPSFPPLTIEFSYLLIITVIYSDFNSYHLHCILCDSWFNYAKLTTCHSNVFLRSTYGLPVILWYSFTFSRNLFLFPSCKRPRHATQIPMEVFSFTLLNTGSMWLAEPFVFLLSSKLVPSGAIIGMVWNKQNTELTLNYNTYTSNPACIQSCPKNYYPAMEDLSNLCFQEKWFWWNIFLAIYSGILNPAWTSTGLCRQTNSTLDFPSLRFNQYCMQFS